MKSLIRKTGLFLFLVLMLISCGDGGLGVAGIGGTGYIATGSVTGFGSIFVNGVEYETNSAIFEVEDVSSSQSDLRLGMVVQVEGSINSDGITGTATFVHYDDLLEGPITALVEDKTSMTKTLDILGITVVVSSTDTAFENTTYASLLTGNVMEVSGFYDENNVLQASYVKLKSTTYTPETVFEIQGIISNLSGNNFELHGLTIDASSANLTNLPNGLQNNVLVEVKGTYDGVTTITANEVEAEESHLKDDGSTVSVEGYITRYVDNSDFDINGYRIDASSANLEPATLILRAGIRVEADGQIINNVLVANEVESRSGSAAVSAFVDSIDTSNNRFTVKVVASQPSVTVEMTTATTTEDDVGSGDHFTVEDLIPGNYVEVRGYETGDSTITATRAKRKLPEEIELQGVLKAHDQNQSITILGVAFPIDPSTTEFDDYRNHNDLINDTTIGQSVIAIEDKTPGDGNPSGIADKVQVKIH